MMAGNCATATTMAEARFRVDKPNSSPRAVKVIALDARADLTVKALARLPWQRASFLTASAFAGASPGQTVSAQGARAHGAMQDWLSDLAGRATDLMAEIESADLVVMVATAGESAQAAALIGEACSLKRVTTTGLIVATSGQSDDVLSAALAALRPWSIMLVIASDDDYIADMLAAMRA